MTANAPQIPRETDREVGTTKKEGTVHDRASIALPPISVGGQTFVMLSSNSTTILRTSRYRAKRFSSILSDRRMNSNVTDDQIG